MSCRHETEKIMFLLNQGEWGNLAVEVKKLIEKGRLLTEADTAFTHQFEVLERKRKVALRKHLKIMNIGICQTHWGFNNCDDSKSFPNNIFPLDKLKLVRSEESGIRVMCDECVTKLPPFRPKYDPPRYKTEVIGTPTSEQFWRYLDDTQLNKLARHFKMPCLREFDRIYEEAEEKRRRSL